MAVFSAVLCPSAQANQTVAALAATTASAEVALGTNVIFAINASQDITIAFGVAGAVPTPTATNFRIPQNVTMTFDTGNNFGSIKVFNTQATPTTIYILPLSKF